LKEVYLLEKSIVLSEEEKGVTKDLYNLSNEVNNEMNFLSFYFKHSGLDTKLITDLKKDLKNDNVEGATNKMSDVIQLATAKKAVLVSKGMADSFPDELAAKRDKLSMLNNLQNEKENKLKILHEANKEVYKELYAFISKISQAGKIFFKGKKKADEYTISKLIKRMRSGNEGGKGGDGGATPSNGN